MEYLSVEDVQQIVRLLGNVAGMDVDLATKRRTLMSGLSTLVRARYWLWAQACDDKPGRAPVGFMVLDGGWESETQRMTFALGTMSSAAEIINHPVRRLHSSHRTTPRRELVPDEPWFASELVQRFFAPAGIGESVWSVYPLGNETFSSIVLLRPAGEPGFSPREVCIIHLIIQEIDWLHRDGGDIPAAGRVNDLTTRQRMVLIHLLAGGSVKEIARKLSISSYTVTDHIKAIHSRFGVSSRGELLSKFISGAASMRRTP